MAVLAPTAFAHNLFDHNVPSFAPQAPLSTANATPAARARVGAGSTRSRPATRTPTSTSSRRAARPTPRSARSAIGPNGGGQTIVQLTDRTAGRPELRRRATRRRAASATRARRSASSTTSRRRRRATRSSTRPTPAPCAATPSSSSTPATPRAAATTRASSGSSNAPQGGLEIVDVTDIANPVEIGLTSHIGEAHTVNVDPKRPHIAYVGRPRTRSRVNDDGTAQQRGHRRGDALDLDGFEVVDISSCMNFPAGTTVEAKRDRLPARRSTATATRASTWRSATPRPGRRSTAATSSRSTRTTGSPAEPATR